MSDSGTRTRWLAPALVVILGLSGAWALRRSLTPPNHPPSFLKGPDITVSQDSGPYEPGNYGRCFATDSAAAATALACGRKTDDGKIACAPSGTALQTIAEDLRAAYGSAIGVVSTVQFSHATPACFVSHNLSRGNYPQIGDEIINATKPEVVIGSGHPAWTGSYTYLGPAAADDTNYRRLKDGSAGYTLAERVAGQDGSAALTAAALSTTRLFGLFGGPGSFEPPLPTGDGTGSFTVSAAAAENPSLAAAATAALTVLSRNPNGLFLMVEGGDIDWANHANNYPWLLGALHQFEEAVKAGEAFVDNSSDMSWGDTLFVVTADHANSFMRLKTPLGQGVLPATDASGIPADGSVLYGGRSAYSSVVFGSHTNELATLYAKGAGAALFEEYMGAQARSWYRSATGRIVDNTQVCEVLKRAAAEAGARHIVLWIADGMQKANEIAYADYRYGSFASLPWASWPVAGYCATWSVSTYNAYAAQRGVAPFDEAVFLADPAALAAAGYDVMLGGPRTYPDDRAALSDSDTVTQLRYFLGGVPPWAPAISANDPGQTVTFLVSNDNPALFSVQPAISPEANLTFAPAPGAAGSATVTVIAQDDGGTAGGGADASAPQTFVITVTPALTSAPDADRDGFPDHIEQALGSSPSDASATPLSLPGPTTKAALLDVERLVIRVPSRRSGADRLRLRGVLSLPPGFQPAGAWVIVDVGGVVRAYQLNVHGVARASAHEVFKLRPRTTAPDGAWQTARFRFRLGRSNLRSALLDEGFLLPGPKTVIVRLFLQQTVGEQTVTTR